MLVIEDSVEVLRALLAVQPPPPDSGAAIRAGLDWLDRARIASKGGARWFRFYDLESGWPILEDHEGDPWRRSVDPARWGALGSRHFTTDPLALLTPGAQASRLEDGAER